MLVTTRTALPIRSRALLHVITTGIVPTDAAVTLNDRLTPILGSSVVHSRVRLTRLTRPGLARPLVAQVDVHLAGQRVRAQVAAGTMSEVVGVLTARTLAQLRLFPKSLDQCLRERPATCLPPSPPELLPPSARRLARHKVYQPMTLTAAEAIAVLEAMDYRFHLFRDRYSRQVSAVIRTGSGHYRIVQPRPNLIGLEAASPPVDLVAAHRLSVAEATARLDLTGASFEIFMDDATGRTCALYARYDGHYGILTPAAACEPVGLT